jgi:hypothetical protein
MFEQLQIKKAQAPLWAVLNGEYYSGWTFRQRIQSCMRSAMNKLRTSASHSL